MTDRPLIPAAVRRYFRDSSADLFVLRDIDNMWQDEGFAPSGKPNHEQGQRRGRWREYEDSVDWTHPGHITRVLGVYDTFIEGFGDEGLARVNQLLERNGFTLGEGRRIAPGNAHLASRPDSLPALRDPSMILDSFDRITRALPVDPAQAIGSAKELIEATAKTVLAELGISFDDKTAKLPKLVAMTEEALYLHPATVAPGPDSSHAVKRILGGLTSIAVGVAELRNEGYGTGHAPAAPRVGLHQRHAYLAVGSAQTWCRLILDTLADPAAPWRATSPTTSTSGP